MTASAYNTSDLTSLLVDMRGFLAQIEVVRHRDSQARKRLTEAAQNLEMRLQAARTQASEWQSSVGQTIDEARAKVAAWREALNNGESRKRLRQLRAAYAAQYETMRLQLRQARLVADTTDTRQEIRPRNYIRNVFHASNAVVAVGLYHYVLTREQALTILGTIFAFYASLEITRRFSKRWNDFLVDKVFGSISRPSERYRVNSATLYLFALTTITFFFSKEAVIPAILALGFGDPIASIVGKRWGKRKLYLDRSYVGTSGFIVASFAVIALYFGFISSAVSLSTGLLVAAVTAVVGAGTELASQKIDDNLSIPIVCAGVAEVLLRVL